jgi:hypothetical protein
MKGKGILTIIIFSLTLFLVTNLYSEQSYNLKAENFRIDNTKDNFQRIIVEGYYSYGVPGYPDLPCKIYRIAVPPEVDPHSIKVNYTTDSVEHLGNYNIREVPHMAAWVDGKMLKGDKADVYGKDQFFPQDCIEYLGFSQMRKWRIVTFKFTPFRYNPVTGELIFIPGAKVSVQYKKTDRSQAINFELTDSNMDRRARKMLLNFKESQAWYKPEGIIPKPSAFNDYVIITTNAIESASSQLASFVNFLTNRGFTPLVITEDEYGGLTGQTPNGTAEKIRKWLQNNYISLSIDYVLLIGNPDPDDPSSGVDSVGDVPMKMCWPRNGATSHPTYDESPTDYFYADLTGNWDLDGDQYFGEYNGDAGTGGIDFANEVYVGRIPVYSGVTNLDSVLSKTKSYAWSTTTTWRKSALLPMSYSDASTDGAFLSQGMKTNYLTPGGYSSWTMYMQGSVCFAANSIFASSQELLDGVTQTRWQNNDYGMVWWWGHGSDTSASLGYTGCGWGTIMASSGASSLDNGHPSFVYQCSCLNGYPETTNNLGTSLLYNGAITTVSASRVSWYGSGSWSTTWKSCGDNASIGYYYGYDIVSGGKYGSVALYDVKADIGTSTIATGWGEYAYMNLMDFNLYGDPVTGIQQRLPEIHLKFKSKNIYNGGTLNAGKMAINKVVGVPFTFTIQNLGNYVLRLTGTPMVILSGSGAKFWMVLQQPPSRLVMPGSTTFVLRTKKSTPPTVPPGFSKNIQFNVTIKNTDWNEDPYTFTIKMTVTD